MAKFWREVFSENGNGSFARVACAFTVLVASACLVYHTMHAGHVPGGLDSGGLATFGVAPYTASRAATTVSSVFNKGPAK